MHECEACGLLGMHWCYCDCENDVPYSYADDPRSKSILLGYVWHGLKPPTVCPECDPRGWEQIERSMEDVNND